MLKSEHINKSIAAVMAAVLVLTSFAGCGKSGKEDETAVNSEAAAIYDGSEIKFGQYEVDTDDDKITEETVWNRKDIEWIVLTKEDGKALVISKYVLDGIAYYKDKDDEEDENGKEKKEDKKDKKDLKDIKWENSTLRTWLNGEFFNNAFSAEEKAKILTTTVTADKNSACDTDQGKDTEDKIFLLSEAEANKYFPSYKERESKPTQYAQTKGVWAYDYKDEFNGNCWWGLRTLGKKSGYACCVNYFGEINCEGDYIDNDSIGVRPAMWIAL